MARRSFLGWGAGLSMVAQPNAPERHVRFSPGYVEAIAETDSIVAIRVAKSTIWTALSTPRDGLRTTGSPSDGVIRVINYRERKTLFDFPLRFSDGVFTARFLPDTGELYCDHYLFTKQQRAILLSREGKLIFDRTTARDGFLFGSTKGHLLLKSEGHFPDLRYQLVHLDTNEVVHQLEVFTASEFKLFGSNRILGYAASRTLYHSGLDAAKPSIVARSLADWSVRWNRASTPPSKLCSSPDDKVIGLAFSISDVDPHSTVELWAAENGRLLETFQINGSGGIALSPEGRYLAIGVRRPSRWHCDMAVAIYEVKTRKHLCEVSFGRVSTVSTVLWGYFEALSFSPDGNYLIASNPKDSVVS